MKLIVGLGNIGDRYVNTRHNVGFMFVDFFLNKQYQSWKMDKKFDAEISRFNVGGEDVIFVKPQTYMNLSGKSVSLIAKFYNIKNEDILIIFDDIDQDFNKVKVKKSSSHGGHNGMRSIISLLKTNDIPRLKFGVGRHKFMPVDKWVLSKFTAKELEDINNTFENKVYNMVEKFIVDGLEKMNNG